MSAIDEYGIFLFDLDGTIADDGGVPSRRILEALARLVELDRLVGIVTARASAEMDDVVDLVGASIAPNRLGSHVRFFTSSASEVYRFSAGGPYALELVAALHDGAERAALVSIGEELNRIGGVTVLNRGPQLTIRANPRAMTQVRWSLGPHLARIRCMFVSTECAHVLPRGAGKHRALEHYNRADVARDVVAIGDGFYELPEAEIRGNDMDLVGAVRTCIHVGKLKPRDPKVIHLALGSDGPSSTVLVLERMESTSTRDLTRRDSFAPSACTALRGEAARVTSSEAVQSFLAELLDYLRSAIDPIDLEQRAVASAAVLRQSQSVLEMLRLLIKNTPLDRGFGRWAGFEGEVDWVLAWLWDEHVSRPGVPIASHFGDRVRAPMMPEELMISLLRVLPHVARGDRVVLIGKDAECLEPLLHRLIRVGQEVGFVSPDAMEPISMKVSARKAAPREAVDASEHLASGSLARQLRSFLGPQERDEQLRPEQRYQVLRGAQTLSLDEQRTLESAFEGHFDHALATMSRGELILRIGDLKLSKEFGDFIAVARVSIYSLQSRLSSITSGPPVSVAALLAGEPGLGERADDIARRYLALTGREVVEDRDDCHTLSRLLFSALGEAYADLRSLEFPFTPVLRLLMAGTRVRALLSPQVLFVDSSFNAGTTILFLRALRHIVAPDSVFQFAAMGGLILHEPLQKDLEWHGHPYVTVLMEEGAPHTFDFFYDENDERVPYASILGPDGSISASPNDEHIESFCRTHEKDIAGDGMPQPLEFRDIVRWWLRRDRIWEMYVLAYKLRFRWPHWRVVKNQQRAIALARRLDVSIDPNTATELKEHDRDLAISETRRVLHEWLGRREEWLSRGFALLDQMVGHPQLLRDYLSKPSAAAWHRLQRKLVAKLRPGNLTSLARIQRSS